MTTQPRTRRHPDRPACPLLPDETFICFDIELANPSHSSTCAIGYTRYRDGQPALRNGTSHWYIRPVAPHDWTDSTNLELTGIRPQDIADGHAFADIGPRIAERFTDHIVVVQGGAGTDISMFEKTWWASGLAASHGPIPDLWFVDPVVIAKSLGYPAKLNELHHFIFGTHLDGHHTADVDADATARIILALLETTGKTLPELAKFRPGKRVVETKVGRGRGLKLALPRPSQQVAA